MKDILVIEILSSTETLLLVKGEANSDGSVKVTTGASVTGSSRLRQKFEYSLAPRPYDGKTFTVSAKVKSNTANARINVYAGGYLSLTGTTAHSGGGSYETLTATFTTPSTINTEFSVHIGIDGASSANVSITSGQYFEVKEVQMEEGSIHTPFEHEPYETTLRKCQRYYYTLRGNPNGKHLGGTTMRNNQYFYGYPRSFPTPMRIAPTFTYNNVSLYVGDHTNGYCTLSLAAAETDVFALNGNAAGAVNYAETGHTGLLYIDVYADRHVTFDAEL
jgi:hypothetical protein